MARYGDRPEPSRKTLRPGREEFPGAEKVSDEELMAAEKARGTTTFHLMGTCRMGAPDDPRSVVDPECRLIGCTGLRVIDASVMPTLIGGNTNAPTIMIGEKAADMIREEMRAH